MICLPFTIHSISSHSPTQSRRVLKPTFPVALNRFTIKLMLILSTVMRVVFLLAISLVLNISYFRHGNLLGLILGCASFFLGITYLISTLVSNIIPQDIITQGWYYNIVTEWLGFVSFTYFFLAIIYARLPKLPSIFSLIALVVGMSVIVNAIAHFQAPSQLTGGGLDYNRHFISDFVPFIFTILIMVALGDFFIRSARGSEHQKSAILVGVGVAIAAIGMAYINAVSPFSITGIVLRFVANFGLLLTLIGLVITFLKKKKTNQQGAVNPPPTAIPLNPHDPR
jgi:hypothetical protein